MLNDMNKEILYSCCAYGGNAIEVYVLESECPIDRELGKRKKKTEYNVVCTVLK